MIQLLCKCFQREKALVGITLIVCLLTKAGSLMTKNELASVSSSPPVWLCSTLVSFPGRGTLGCEVIPSDCLVPKANMAPPLRQARKEGKYWRGPWCSWLVGLCPSQTPQRLTCLSWLVLQVLRGRQEQKEHKQPLAPRTWDWTQGGKTGLWVFVFFFLVWILDFPHKKSSLSKSWQNHIRSVKCGWWNGKNPWPLRYSCKLFSPDIQSCKATLKELL